MNSSTKYKIASKIARKLYNRAYAEGYRKSDDEISKSEIWQKMSALLEEITGNFQYPVVALDLGCGSGRYFSCLKNTRLLDGIDISAEMLEKAKNPISKEKITIGKINLIEADFFEYSFDKKYDFIYSIGVLGEHFPFDEIVMEKIAKIIKQGGVLLFTTVDPEYRIKSLKRKIAQFIYSISFGKLKEYLGFRLKNYFAADAKDIREILSKFNFEIIKLAKIGQKTYPHYFCLAKKL